GAFPARRFGARARMQSNEQARGARPFRIGGSKTMLAKTFPFLRSLLALVLTFVATNFSFAQSLPWMNPLLPSAQRATMLVAAMTLDQKIEQIHGQPGAIPEVPSCGNGGRHVPGIPQLQIPTFRITNGPVGIGAGDCSPQAQATALPSSLA